MTAAESLQNGDAIPRRKQRPMTSRYGVSLRFDVTPALAASIARMSPKKGPNTASDVCRNALHVYCLQYDPVYQREMNAPDGA
jgi:hypothetical protein